DGRFVPALFQGIASGIFEFTSSETGPRIIAFLATATIPAAILLMRHRMGNAAALATLFFLALDPIGIWAGVAASAYAWDLAIATSLRVARARPAIPPWCWAPLACLAATAGSLPAVLALAALAISLARGSRFETTPLVIAAAGAIVGIV